MASRLLSDTVDSIRLKERKKRSSVTFSDSLAETSRSQFMVDLADLDINELDAEMRRLTLDCQGNIQKLRADSTNSSKKQAVLASKERLNRMKEWTSKLNTEEGRLKLEESRRDLENRKYEIDQVLKIVKAQSAADVCFMMDCTGSMVVYIMAACLTTVHCICYYYLTFC